MRLPRFQFSTSQMLLLTALAALCVALAMTVYQRVRHAARPVAAAWSQDGELAGVRFSDGRVRLWKASGEPSGSLSTGQFWAMWTTTPALAIIDAQHIATTEAGDGKIEVWSVPQQQRLARFGSSLATPFWETASISRDGRWLATIRIGANPGIDVWDVAHGVRRNKLRFIGTPRRLVMSHDGSRLAVLDHNRTLTTIDVSPERRISGPILLPTLDVDRDAVAVSGDLQMVAVVARQQSDERGVPIEIVPLGDGRSPRSIHVPTEVETLSLSDDGRLLATASPHGNIAVWNAADGRRLAVLSLPVEEGFESTLDLAQSPTVVLSFSPDGQSLLAGTNTTVGIYDASTLQLRHNLGVASTRLGREFFMLSFALWAVLWGYATRRAQRASNATTPASVPAADASVPSAPPAAMIAVWILLFAGGLWAIAWAMIVLFSSFTCLALTPFPYFGLYVGLRAAAAGTSRARTEFNLPAVAILQMAALMAGDVINPILGVANTVLLQTPRAKQYRTPIGKSPPTKSEALAKPAARSTRVLR